MSSQTFIQKTKEFVQKKLENEGSGHDWWHIQRVYTNAKLIAASEPSADVLVVKLGALLHDIADWKFHGGTTEVGAKVATDWLISLGAPPSIVGHVTNIVNTVSFKGAGAEKPMTTLEGKIVRDADRLDALGAVGIARCFTYGGYKGNPIHIPGIKPSLHKTFEDYKSGDTTQINHFYEKLLLLKNLMLTKTGKKLAEQRHDFMVAYLNQFFSEWNDDPPKGNV